MKPNISLACKKSPFFHCSRAIAPKENFPPILALTLKLTQTLTPIGRAIFFGGNCPDTSKNKRNEKPVAASKVSLEKRCSEEFRKLQ